jgi:hypothetical protein
MRQFDIDCGMKKLNTTIDCIVREKVNLYFRSTKDWH